MFSLSDENQKWFRNLSVLVEAAFVMNNETRITFVAHSMGGRMLLHFLQQMPLSWKDKYVEKAITMSVPWGGAVQSLQAISIGYDFGSYLIQNEKMKEVQETCPSVAWLIPSKYFWKADEVIAKTNEKNYTVENIDEFFQ